MYNAHIIAGIHANAKAAAQAASLRLRGSEFCLELDRIQDAKYLSLSHEQFYAMDMAQQAQGWC